MTESSKNLENLASPFFDTYACNPRGTDILVLFSCWSLVQEAHQSVSWNVT